MSDLVLNSIEITQSIGQFYLSKISPEKLLEMSYVDRRRIEDNSEFLGIQRELKPGKIASIKSYLRSVDATFPNSIIVNTTMEYIVSKTSTTLVLKENPNTFTIIDGQHRLEGFRDNPLPNFELIISIFIDLQLSQQANIFSTINSQQTKVDSSLNYNLELNSLVYTPKKMMIEVAQSFNHDKESPWFKNIKFGAGENEGILSLSAFVAPLLDFTYPENLYYEIRNTLIENNNNVEELPDFGIDISKYIFWSLYKRKQSHIVYKILYNYFKALKDLLPNDWLNENSILTKTTGYNAIMKLFKDLSFIGMSRGDLSYNFFFERLKNISAFDNQINSSNYGASGYQASNDLYRAMVQELEIN